MVIKSYMNMSRTEIDAAYNNTDAVEDFTEIMHGFNERSIEIYKKYDWLRDLHYGDKKRERFDFLSCGDSSAPTYIFFHGGYWSNCNKEDFAFIAEGPVNNNMNVILAEYTLAPEATMTEIVEETGRLIEHIASDKSNLGLSESPLYLAGHSAGGHLASLYRSHEKISKVHMISALVDLHPISFTWLQKNLKLSLDEMKLYSPLFNIKAGAPTLISVGAKELRELIRHSTDYAIECENDCETVGLIYLPHATHFSILNDLADQNGLQLKALVNM